MQRGRLTDLSYSFSWLLVKFWLCLFQQSSELQLPQRTSCWQQSPLQFTPEVWFSVCHHSLRRAFESLCLLGRVAGTPVIFQRRDVLNREISRHIEIRKCWFTGTLHKEKWEYFFSTPLKCVSLASGWTCHFKYHIKSLCVCNKFLPDLQGCGYLLATLLQATDFSQMSLVCGRPFFHRDACEIKSQTRLVL